MNAADFLAQAARDTEAALDSLLPLAEGPERPLYEAMRYSVFAGGKRLRPALFLATAELFGLDRQGCLPWAAALEMIHTYSLIHDDLPGMDNDDWRRGRPTCHVAFGEALAILAGDGLLTEALGLLMRPLSFAEPLRQLKAAGLIADRAGASGMVGGQAAEFALANGALGREQLDYIYERKTGALFAAAILSAALLAGADEQALAALGSYCRYLGLAFQITDDVLDVESSREELGKPIGSDRRNGKITYASLLGCGPARQRAGEAAARAATALKMFGPKAAVLRDLAPLLTERRN